MSVCKMPVTSVSLLREISVNANSKRWTEFYERYADSMRAFLAARFPSVEPADVMQETMIVLSKRLSGYTYRPEAHGHFRNYLMGIVKHKAMDEMARRSRETSARERLAAEPPQEVKDEEETAFRKAVLEVAIEQLMSDESIGSRTREVFRHVALMHEDPAEVSSMFGITRNNVDQIKRRLMSRLGEIVSRLA